MNIDFIHLGDCMQWLPTLPDGCADMVLTDPPYGTMHAAWDVRPDVPALFAELWRVLKRNGALCVFAQLPPPRWQLGGISPRASGTRLFTNMRWRACAMCADRFPDFN